MRVALVHDYLVQYGGAERVLEALQEIFPYAPVYTLIYDPKQINYTLTQRKTYTSFLQKIPFAGTHHRLLSILMPLAIEQFNLRDFDIIISDSNSFSKGVITDSETLHVCYCHTPMRYAWDDCHKYTREFTSSRIAQGIIPFVINYIRLWDKISANRPDYFICNSGFVKNRIKKYYQREATVIYPPVNTEKFKIISGKKENYFLMVGRLLPYKRFDLAIETFKRLKLPLKIIGDGPEAKELRKKARAHIEFLGRLSDKQIAKFYAKARALIFPQEEDFGITALEAMSSGTPVIAFRGGGALETIKENKTGLFFDEQSVKSVSDAIGKFIKIESIFNPNFIRQHALLFDKKIFQKKILKFVEEKYDEFTRIRNKSTRITNSFSRDCPGMSLRGAKRRSNLIKMA